MQHVLNKLKIYNYPVLKIDWSDIPLFAVISGINGSGKTHLLNAINKHVMEGDQTYSVDTDLNVTKDEFGYILWDKNVGGLAQADVGQFAKEKEGLINTIIHSSNRGNNKYLPIIAYFQEKFDINLRAQSQAYFDGNEFRKGFHEAWIYTTEVTDNQHISRLFLRYQSNFIREMRTNYKYETGSTSKGHEIEKEIGLPPWKIINDLFEQYGFKYRITCPEDVPSNYNPYFFNINDLEKRKIQFQGLSAGEMMIVRLILWSFSSEFGNIKKLLVMDEPDAHLHPQMAKMFKEIISDKLVKEFGIQVIITTHSPTTLCWMEEKSIFLMEPEKGIRKASKKTLLAYLHLDCYTFIRLSRYS